MADIIFYLDENIPIAVAKGLNRRGIVVITTKESNNLGLSDEDHLKYTTERNLVLITHDDDFLSIADKNNHSGIVYVHQEKYTVGEMIEKLKFLWETLEQKDMKDHIQYL